MDNIIIDSLVFMVRLLWSLVKALFGILLPTPKKNVSGKVILITGSAHGIGKEMAIRFHKMGAQLALIDINQSLNDELVSELKSKNANKVVGYRCDLTSESDIEMVAGQVLRDFGHVDILINNAGFVRCAPLLNLNSQDIRRTFDVNVFSHFWMIKQILPSMIERKKGQIVAISSIAGLTGTANLVDYCSSKFAVNGLMTALDCELRSQGHHYIELTTMCPYAISTGMFKKPKTRFSSLFPILTPEYTAETIVDAVRSSTFMRTIPRTGLLLASVEKMLPRESFKLIQNFFVYGVDEH